MSWQPDASIAVLKQRAAIVDSIRDFFKQRGVLEVETPALSAATVTDVHLHTFSTEFSSPVQPGVKTLYLQTSPEYAMKRLLCAGSGPIFQIAKAFRNEEAGTLHNPEFSLLEWYRPGFDHFKLMDEVDELMQLTVKSDKASRMTYQQAFIDFLGIDPLEANLLELKHSCGQAGFADIAEGETNPDTLLQLLFSHIIEPRIAQDRPCFVYEFPASQAALAKISAKDNRVAERFELYFKGIELANGFHELTDAEEQLKRFEQDNELRRSMQREVKTIDKHLLAGLTHGMPDCAGVALGVDRLLMLILGERQINKVMTFSINKA